MKITLKNNEELQIISDKHEVCILSDYNGELSYMPDKKSETKVTDVLFEKQIEALVHKQVESGWGRDRLTPMIEFLKDITEKGSKALKVDKSKLLALMIEKLEYSAINYFQQFNFYNFKSVEELQKKIDGLNEEIWNTKKTHEKEIIDWQKKLTEAQKLEVTKIEVDGDTHLSYGISVNCPFCNKYQDVDIDDSDWHPGQEYDGNQECEDCGKWFSVKSNGDI